MLRREDITVGDIVRLKSGSPKFIVAAIRPYLVADEGVVVEIFGWSDRQGFVSEAVPLAWLVRPMLPRETEG